MIGNTVSGARYLAKGLDLVRRPEVRMFVIAPILINIVMFILLTAWIVVKFQGLIEWSMTAISWLSWFESLMWLVWSILSFFLLFIYGYTFGILANLIAAPFNGLLAEKVEELLTGKKPPAEDIKSIVLRTMGRELEKLWYFFSRGLVILFIGIVFFWVPFLSPALYFLWGAWTMAIQYSDYAVDNNQQSFALLKTGLRGKIFYTLGFGSTTLLLKMVPLLNIVVMPVAVAGGTAMWIEQFRQTQETPATDIVESP